MARLEARRVEAPERTRMLDEISDADYTCAFELARSATDLRTAEQWSRAVFEGASMPVRALLTLGWRIALGLRMGPRQAEDHVLGWRVRSARPDLLVLEQDSQLIVAHNVAQVDDTRVIWTTFVRYRNPFGRVAWVLTAPFHLFAIPRLLGHAARRRRDVKPVTVTSASPLGHYARFLSPDAVAAGRLVLEGEVKTRVRRIAEVQRARRRAANSQRGRMRGLVVVPGGRWGWRSMSAPGRPGPAAAVVRPLAVATCDADRAIMLGRTPFALPLHLGHECVAEVVEVGDQVATVRVGQRVVVPFQISCGTCSPCRQGRTANCASVPKVSMYGFGFAGGLWGGVLADLVAVPYADAMLVPLPDGIDPQAAASVADNVSDAYRTIGPYLPALLEIEPNAGVLLVGSLQRHSPFTASALMYAGLIARAMGARNVTMVDARPAVRAHAERIGLPALGADHRSWPVAALTVDATTTNAGLRKVLRHTAPDGACICAWSLHRRAAIPLMGSYLRNLTLHVGRSHARTNIPHVLELMSDSRLQPEVVSTNIASFDEAPDALRDHCREEAVKTILVALP